MDDETNKLSVLAIGPHPDDIELGCFGTLSKYASIGADIHMLVLTDGESGGDPEQRIAESRAAARLLNATIHLGKVPDTRITDGVETIQLIEHCMAKVKPSVVIGPSAKDAHQDHRNAARAMISATRYSPDLVLVYQTPSTTRDFLPIFHVDVTDCFAIKAEAIRAHRSQSGRQYMAADAVEGLARYRAMEVGMRGCLVEGFEVIRMIRKFR